MLTIGQLAAYAGVTVRAVRHYHQVGLLPEPERDASGYRRYDARAVVSLIKIRTLADAGVPLARIDSLLRADPTAFAEAVARLDDQLAGQIAKLQTSREQIARLAAGDIAALPPEVAEYLDRLRGLGLSERLVEGERDGWILIAAQWPDRVRDWMPAKLAELDNPLLVRLYRLLSELVDGDTADERLLADAADILVGLAEQAEAAGQLGSYEQGSDGMPLDLVEGLAYDSDPRARRIRELMRERGWDGWVRMERVGD